MFLLRFLPRQAVNETSFFFPPRFLYGSVSHKLWPHGLDSLKGGRPGCGLVYCSGDVFKTGGEERRCTKSEFTEETRLLFSLVLTSRQMQGDEAAVGENGGILPGNSSRWAGLISHFFPWIWSENIGGQLLTPLLLPIRGCRGRRLQTSAGFHFIIWTERIYLPNPVSLKGCSWWNWPGDGSRSSRNWMSKMWFFRFFGFWSPLEKNPRLTTWDFMQHS